jgi:hypothetical protein
MGTNTSACTAVVDNADITKAVKDFKIVDLRIMNSPNSSPIRGYNFNLYIIPYYIEFISVVA